MKSITCTNGDMVLIDDEDYIVLNRHTWYINNNGYSFTSIGNSVVLMHRLIFGTALGTYMIDHKNQNKLDNQKANLRLANKRNNSLNCKQRKNSKSGYRGVRVTTTGFYAYTTYNSKQLIFGYYKDIEEAARARDAGMLQLHGPEFVILNFPKVD